MALEWTASDLETRFGTAAYKFDREAAVLNQGYEQVARLLQQSAEFAQIRGAEPVEFLLYDSRRDAGQKQFLLAELSEVKEVDVDLYALLSAPGKDVFLEDIKTGLLDIDDHIDGRNLAQRQDSGRDVADIFLYLPLAEES